MKKLNIETINEPNVMKNYFFKEKKTLILTAVTGILYNCLTVAAPIYQGKLIDSLVSHNPLYMVVRGICIYIAVILSAQFFRYFKRFYVRRFANSTSASMRLTIYNNIMNKSITELNNENIGNLMTRIISDVELCVEGMRKVTTEIFDTGVMMLACLFAMIRYDVKITLLSCLFIPIAMILAEKLKVLIYKYTSDYRKTSSKATDLIYENIEHTVLFRINGIEKINKKRYTDTLDELEKKAVKANILENSMQPIYNIIALLGIIIVVYLGGGKVISGDWTIGTFSAYLVMFSNLSLKASKGAKLFNSAQKSKISWLRIKPYLGDYINTKEAESILTDKTTMLNVDNLSFSYGEAENVIQNISFTAKSGDIIGITGPIACGKSSLGIALTGIYEYNGSIKIGGNELKNYSDAEKSSIISYMGHNPSLLSDTIYNNITLGENISHGDVLKVLKDVCFDEDLENMPDKENTIVGNSGIRLSGGQQQRIALARTLIRKNKIIILDDPFSAVDMKTEEKIIANLRKNYSDCIIIIISHRLTIFKDVEKIILMDKNKSSIVGTHNELIKTSEIYSTIYSIQSGEDNEK